MNAILIFAAVIAAAADRPIVILNEDNSHFFGSRKAEDMTIEGLHAFVDQYANTCVTHLFLNPNAMRASFDSNTRDDIWDVGNQVVPADIPFARAWVDNARLLHERGLDPYAVWIARCREKSISPWLTMRMNDVHDVDDTTNYMHSTFWLEHPECWRVPHEPKGSWTDRALNYAMPAVREHNMAFVAELLDRYDPDGIELDWMRFGYHFRAGHERVGAEVLTQFMRDARTLTDEWSRKRGHRIQLGARVPADPDAAIGLGMDGVRWAREGLIDVLVPTPFWATADFDIPVEEWKKRIGDADDRVLIAPGTEVLVRAYPGGEAVLNDLASVYGFASGAWARGADALYLFNYMDPAPILGGVEAYRALLEKGLTPEFVTTRPRRYVATYRDTVPEGVSNNAQLPIDSHGEIRFFIGNVPEGGKAIVLLGVTDRDGAPNQLSINGVHCDFLSVDAPPESIVGANRVMRFAVPESAAKPGVNVVTVSPAPVSEVRKIVWAELQVDGFQTPSR
ncbi:MAG: hypothetical protein HUU46_03260 [Candidatus Hydrogenedentes bacterium]|nr:hypothetical protein [Candidatus Hydrogenedentota bacterium]